MRAEASSPTPTAGPPWQRARGRFLRQTVWLTRKNLLLAFRSRGSTSAQLCVGVGLLILLLILNAAIVLGAKSNSDFSYTPSAQALNASFAPCVPSVLTGKCYSFAFANAWGSGNSTLENLIIDRTAALLNISSHRNVPGGILAFPSTATAADVDSWILENPNTTRTVILFENTAQWQAGSKHPMRYTMQLNLTNDCQTLAILGCTEPMLFAHVPLQTALDAAIIAVLNSSLTPPTINVAFTNFPHPDLPASFDVMQQYGALFFYVALTFLWVIQLQNIVQEKEDHLIEFMKQMGMTATAYWLSWFFYVLVCDTLMVFLIMFFGFIMRFPLFVKTDGQLLLTVFWLSAMSFSSLAFFFSTLVRTTATARVIGVLSFLIFFIAAPLLTSIYFADPNQTYDVARIVLSIIPFISYFELIDLLIQGSSGSTTSGYKWSDVKTNILPASATNTYVTYWSVQSSMLWLLYSFLIFTGLAIYLENVMPSEYGRAHPLWFFLTPDYWGCRCRSRVPSASVPKKVEELRPVLNDNMDEDVRAEAQRVYDKDFGDTPPAVIVRGLTKTFGWRTKFKAVDSVWYSIPEGQLFALLGHNGSGKSTTFNALTGLTNVSAGDAEIFGKSVRGDMAELHAQMGVCPQHDILFEQLTATEHLEMFATIKGFQGDVREEAQKRIAQVKLQSAANRAVKGFSGGMRRRLSIAIALLGDPRIVFLDEPTTGMDPVTRAEVLDMISEAKTGRVIVLTSHAMEEVEFLADKVAVMSRGKIQAVGTTLRLKRRFGGGFRLSVLVESREKVDAVVAFVVENAPEGSSCTSNVETSLQFSIAGKQENKQALLDFFRRFENAASGMGVVDFSLGQSSLEDVFLNLARHERDDDQSAAKPLMLPARGGGGSALALPTMQEIKRRVTAATQIKALCLKSATFQLRNCLGCCCVVLFPVVIMVALIILQGIIFTPLKITAVCGPNISKSQCLTQGFNLTCVSAQQQYQPFTQVDSVDVGLIDLNGGNRGSGVNVNCDTVTCYNGLEKMDVRGFPTMGMGAVAVPQSNTTESLLDWYTNLLFILGNTTCVDTFANAFDANKVCTDPATSPECSSNVTQLQVALQYYNAVHKSGTGTYACLPNPSGVVNAPSNSSLAQLAVLQAQLRQCTIQTLVVDVIAQCQTLNITQALSELNTTVLSFGLVENLSFEQLQDPVVNTFRDFLWTTLQNLGPVFGGPNYTLALNAWYAANGLNPSDINYTPTLAEMCTPPFPLAILIPNAYALANLCAYAENSDAVRGASPVSYSTQSSLDISFIDTWFGQERQTALMRTMAPSLPLDKQYLQRFFFSRFSGVHFLSSVGNAYHYVIYTNRTASHDDETANWKQMLATVEAAILSRHLKVNALVRYKEMPVAFHCNRDAWLRGEVASLQCDLLTGALQYSILDFVAAQLFPFIFLLLAYLIVNLIVDEKENKLRIIMRINGGLRDSVYWFVTYVFFFVQFMIMSLFIYITGRVAQIFFVSDAGIYWLFIFTWANCLVAFSFLLSVFFSSTRTSTAVTFLLILLFGLVGINLISSIILDSSSTESSYAPLMWIPPFVMIRYVLWVAVAGGLNTSIAFAELSTFADGALAKCIGIMWGEWAACLILVWYLDQTLVGGVGVQRHPLFFLDRTYWCGPAQDASEENLGEIPEPLGVELLLSNGADVQAEYKRVVEGTDPKLAVRVVRLHKRFGDFDAVKSLSLGINKGECFGWLGHNGAGKTTAINMLCGLYSPTSGTALVEGLSIKTEMDLVQTRMGVCPQHDLTWAQLTCREHLLFYARLKGVPSAHVASAVDAALVDVNLKTFEHRRAGRLSGGMRRRLSVAMSLIGSPSVVYMDEPSTGLDPASKRSLWDVISRAKGNKSIVLTTHSMEECEVLCDRVGIMALGELQCIGTSAELKSRYGAGYTLSVTTGKGASDQVVDDFVAALFPSATRLKQSLGARRYEVPRKGVVLSAVFETMESPETQAKLDMLDWSLQETSLDDVFLLLAERASVQEAMSARLDPRRKTASQASVPWWKRCPPWKLSKSRDKEAKEPPVVGKELNEPQQASFAEVAGGSGNWAAAAPGAAASSDDHKSAQSPTGVATVEHDITLI